MQKYFKNFRLAYTLSILALSIFTTPLLSASCPCEETDPEDVPTNEFSSEMNQRFDNCKTSDELIDTLFNMKACLSQKGYKTASIAETYLKTCDELEDGDVIIDPDQKAFFFQKIVDKENEQAEPEAKPSTNLNDRFTNFMGNTNEKYKNLNNKNRGVVKIVGGGLLVCGISPFLMPISGYLIYNGIKDIKTPDEKTDDESNDENSPEFTE